MMGKNNNKITLKYISCFLLSCLILIILVISLFLSYGYDFVYFKKDLNGEKIPVFVIEGWVDDSVLKEASKILKKFSNARIFVVGNKIEYGKPLLPANNFADLGRLILIRNGVNEKKIIAVHSSVLKNRTFAAAQSLKAYLAENELKINGINIITKDIHSKRTYLTFRKVFGNSLKIGVTPISDEKINRASWRKSSEGIKSVLSEDVALIYYYVRFLGPFK